MVDRDARVAELWRAGIEKHHRPTKAELAQQIGCDPRTVGKSLRRLERAGRIRRPKSHGSTERGRYR